MRRNYPTRVYNRYNTSLPRAHWHAADAPVFLTAMKRIALSLFVLSLLSCANKREGKVVAPWGEVATETTLGDDFDLDQIVAGGEMIVLTLSGPDTYYEYRGRRLGMQYLVCQRLADRLGVSLRVEVCRDTLEIVRRLARGDGDLAALPLAGVVAKMPKDSVGGVTECGAEADTSACHWLVGGGKEQLASEIKAS